MMLRVLRAGGDEIVRWVDGDGARAKAVYRAARADGYEFFAVPAGTVHGRAVRSWRATERWLAAGATVLGLPPMRRTG